jgi:hypothetical protein
MLTDEAVPSSRPPSRSKSSNVNSNLDFSSGQSNNRGLLAGLVPQTTATITHHNVNPSHDTIHSETQLTSSNGTRMQQSSPRHSPHLTGTTANYARSPTPLKEPYMQQIVTGPLPPAPLSSRVPESEGSPISFRSFPPSVNTVPSQDPLDRTLPANYSTDGASLSIQTMPRSLWQIGSHQSDQKIVQLAELGMLRQAYTSDTISSSQSNATSAFNRRLSVILSSSPSPLSQQPIALPSENPAPQISRSQLRVSEAASPQPTPDAVTSQKGNRNVLSHISFSALSGALL